MSCLAQIGRDASGLTDDALATKPAGMGEDRGPVVLKVLVEPDPGHAAKQQLPQLVLAPLERERSQIDAVESHQVEGVERSTAVVLPAVQQLEICDAHRIADDNLAMVAFCGRPSMAPRSCG
jgi:hypothetical protein